MCYNSIRGNMFIIKKPEKGVQFVEIPTGLYYHNRQNHKIALVNTVK